MARAGHLLSPPVASLLLLLLLLSLVLLPVSLCYRPWPTAASFNGTTIPDLSGSKKYEGSSDFIHLRYHMGPVLTSTLTVHPIWYGSQWTPSQKRILRAFLRSLSPSNSSLPPPSPSLPAWWRTVQLYTDQTLSNVTRSVRLGAEKSDRRASHGRSLTRLSVQSIIRSATTARTRPLPLTPAGALYLVLTSPDVSMEGFCGQVCGFHYFTFPSVVGAAVPYAWVGNSAAQCPGTCAYPFAVPPFAAAAGRRADPPPNGDVGVDGMVSVVAHELAEAATNPLGNAWYAGEEPSFPVEIADLCEGIYGSGGGGAYMGQIMRVDGRSDGAAYNVNGVGGRKFLVQWVWHPYLNYCFGPNALDQ